jgi:hypothetical protein
MTIQKEIDEANRDTDDLVDGAQKISTNDTQATSKQIKELENREIRAKSLNDIVQQLVAWLKKMLIGSTDESETSASDPLSTSTSSSTQQPDSSSVISEIVEGLKTRVLPFINPVVRMWSGGDESDQEAMVQVEESAHVSGGEISLLTIEGGSSSVAETE